ncbi:MAG: ABC transporter permease [Planctomycetota bacterium]
MSSLLAAFAEGVRHLGRHPLRAALAALTCAVAIAVTVNVVSLSYGMDEDIRRDIARFGRLTLDVGRAPVVRPGAPRASFGEAELATVRATVAGLDATVVPLRSERVTATGDVEVRQMVLAAVGVGFPRTLSIALRAGRFLRPDDHGLSACVLDESSAKSLFPGLAPAAVLGRTVRLARPTPVDVPVVGVLEDPMTYRALFEAFDEGRGARTLISALLSFRNVYVPEDAVASVELTTVSVVLPDEARLATAYDRLVKVWPAGGVDADPATLAPVNVFARKAWMDAFGGATQTGAFLGNIVWILVCLVACVMISTLNLVAIRERYDELAIRRCEGARRRDVVAQVAAEGLVTSFVGGLAGLPLGVLGADVLARIVRFPFRFDARFAGVAVLVSVVLGLLSSAVPARRAAALDPAAVLSRRLS